MQVFFKVLHHWSDPAMLVRHSLTQSVGISLGEIAVVRAEEFLQVMKGQQYNIYQHLDQSVSDQSKEIQLHC